ncbi:chemotaxis protein MotC [Xanthobacter flavus]|uniref:Chemotaxis protein MotC n=1 Tax=Xanthobacter flavus TaxID=281 RepID=A0ABU1KG46_XANFL|nr:chemotaxis protein MotC [Xanthobacter flavus]MDR6333807.1 chemotaxis protein MotC [Xanthobacter flavus]
MPMAPARAPAAAPVLAPPPVAAEAGGILAGTPAPLLAETTGASAPPASEPMAPIPEPVPTAAPAAHAAAEPAHDTHSAPAPAQDPPAEPSPAHADTSAPHARSAEAAPPAGRTDIYPVTLVRRLQRLQDLIAAGSTAGIAQQRAMITEMDAAFGDADPSVWQDPANARALVMYFLGGGNPAVLRAIINREPKPNIDEKLLTGSLLYLEGREEPALRQLGEIDARKLPNGIGGQIALAQAALTVRSDPAKASRLLEVARLLMPGTLVDEAALRRAVLVAAQAGDLDQFERLSGQYFSRFRHSAYAGNFRQRFAAALSRMNVLATPDGLSRLDALLAPLDEEARREVFLLVSRSAIVEGKTALATTAAERAMVLAPAASRDAERARVYLSAAQAATPDRYKTAEEALKAIDRARLDPSDQALLEAARRTAELIRRADEAPSQTTSPAPAAAPSAPAVVASAQPARTAGDEKPSAALTKAQAKLGEIDSLLKDAPR